MSHEVQDAISFELAQRIASGLPHHPEWLERWSRLNANVPSLLRCYDEWKNLLQHGVSEICAGLTAETRASQRLRQNSPFAGSFRRTRSGKSSRATAMQRPQLEHIIRAAAGITDGRMKLTATCRGVETRNEIQYSTLIVQTQTS
jgi:hypothetical protein